MPGSAVDDSASAGGRLFCCCHPAGIALSLRWACFAGIMSVALHYTCDMARLIDDGHRGALNKTTVWKRPWWSRRAALPQALRHLTLWSRKRGCDKQLRVSTCARVCRCRIASHLDAFRFLTPRQHVSPVQSGEERCKLESISLMATSHMTASQPILSLEAALYPAASGLVL